MPQRERQRNRARERLGALAEAMLDPEEARRTVIDTLRPAVGFERWCWPLTDPTSALSTGGIGEFDFWPSLPRLIALEEHGDITSKPRLATGRRASVTLSAATRGDLARSRRWRECLQPYGIGDELMTVCRDRHGCWGSVELMRDSDNDLVDAALRPTSWTPAFADWLTELNGDGPPGTAMLPPAIYEIGTRVLTPAADASGLPASVRIRTAAGRWASIEGAALEGADAGHVAITIRGASANEVFDLLCKTYDLTKRERQLTALVLDGLATKQLAEALVISPYTVQDHLKAIFAKTHVRSRRELISHLAGSGLRHQPSVGRTPDRS